MFKNILCFLILIFCCGFVFAQKQTVEDLSSKYSFKKAEQNILGEEESTKTLILKYAQADAKDKPAIKKDIEKQELSREEERIEKQKMRIKRQEEQIKKIKQKLEQREKNKNNTVKERVEYLISDESVEKIKNESEEKKVIDKVKTKTKSKKK